MSNLPSRRSRSNLSRSQRESRAFRMVMVSGGAGLVAVAGLVLAVAGVIGYGLFVIALIVAVAAGLLFRRSVG